MFTLILAQTLLAMENKDFNSLFQDSAAPQRERLSPNSWRKLERRLEKHDRWREQLQRISVHMVVIVLLFIAAIGPLTINLFMAEQRRQAELRNPAPVLEIISPSDSISVPGVRLFLEWEQRQGS